MDYSKFYSEFAPRALNTIKYNFDLIQVQLDTFCSINSEIGNIRNLSEYIGMLQKILTLVLQMEEKDKLMGMKNV